MTCRLRQVLADALRRVAPGTTIVRATLFTVVLFTISCSSDNQTLAAEEDNIGGTLVVATAADADYLFPPLVTTSQGRAITEILFDHLATVGDELNVIGDDGFDGRLAKSWTWAPDSLSIVFTIDSTAKWHDGVKVSSKDVAFSYSLYTNPDLASPIGGLLHNIDSVTTGPGNVARVWLKEKHPTSFYDAAAQMLILPEHVYGSTPAAQLKRSDIIRTPVGSGRFRLRKWIAGQSIDLSSDTDNYRGRAKLDRVLFRVSPDFNAASMQLLGGEADLYESVNIDLLHQIEAQSRIRVHTFPGFDYGFLMFNLRARADKERAHPMFGDSELRRALSMAVDREAIVKNILDTLGYPSVGPMLRAMPTTDTSLVQIQYNPEMARGILDSMGWQMSSYNTGIRQKDGIPLRFTLITPNSSRNRVNAAVIIQAQLKEIGAKVDIQQMEATSFFKQVMNNDFDAAMYAWSLDASPANIVQTWGSNHGGNIANSNYSGYESHRFDALVDSALRSESLTKARSYFSQAYQTILNDAPAIWIYEMKGALAVDKRFVIDRIRPDAWWTHLADWYIPHSQRIARDRISPSAN